MFAFVACIVTFSAACPAQKLCPWLNVATASGFLGGPATLTLNMTGQTTGTCTFQLQPDPSGGKLSIAVVSAPTPQNGNPVLIPFEGQCTAAARPLTAIGNEAVTCEDSAGAVHGRQVIGRVRDSIFTLTLTASAAEKSDAVDDRLAGKAEAIAEQVAGILF
jgi:hypothetical protein